LSTTLHEITHVLGFSAYLFNFFVDENGNKLGYHNIVKETPRRGLDGTVVLMLPSVTRIAREHYNCTDIEGQELENRGDLGSRGSHWEQIVLKNEMLTAISTPDRVYSQFTLAVLEGTGWYEVNYEQAQNLYWGKNKGCPFLEGNCKSNSIYDEFCSAGEAVGCTFDTIGLAECGEGGPFFDSCMSYNKYSNGDCRLSTNDQELDSGEIFSTYSKCVLSNFVKKGGKSKYDVRCYEAYCTFKDGKQQLNFKLSDGTLIECDKSGQIVKAPKGWQGKLTCPNIEHYCNMKTPSECPFGCWNNGICLDGGCHCYPNWTGDDCSHQLSVKS
jgi:leishmanolysin